LTIEEVEIIPLDTVPALRRTLPTGPIAYGESGLVGRSVLVAVRGGGVSGWGQIRPNNPFQADTASSAVAALRDFYAPLAIGRSAWRLTELLGDMARRLPPNPSALAMIDVALHDLLGRALGVPAHALLGGACKDRIPLEWSVGVGPVDQMVDEAERVYREFETPYICFKVGPAERLRENIETLSQVRALLGDEVELALDANGSLSAREAIALGNALEDIRIAYFEQPVPIWDLVGLKRVREAIRAPIMADESVYSPQDAARVVREDCADVLGIKLYKCGGLLRGRQIGIVAEAAGYEVNCAGTANGSHLEALAAAHLGAATPNHAFGAEFTIGLPQVAEDPIAPEPLLELSGGCCTIPDGPGLGPTIDLSAVNRHAVSRIVVE
ncbi:MAG: enolase C-terminal domain-like protein, partial [Pseudomonadota bacterium]